MKKEDIININECDKDYFCKLNCKGYQDIGYCLMDGRCQSYINFKKNANKE